MIDPADTQIPIRRQCELLGLHRSTLYYPPRGEDAFNERLMRLILVAPGRRVWEAGVCLITCPL